MTRRSTACQQVLENRIGQANAQAIEQVCEDLLGETVVWSAPLDRVRQRARVIARAITRGRLGRVCTLTALTKALRDAALAQEQCREVLDLAASLWVDAEVAARLRAAFAGAGGVPRAVALNSGRVRHGARMAVWRAQIPDTAENVYWVAGGGSDGWSSELAERMCAAYLDGNKGQIFDLDDARDVLSVRTERVVFVVPPPLPDEWSCWKNCTTSSRARCSSPTQAVSCHRACPRTSHRCRQGCDWTWKRRTVPTTWLPTNPYANEP